MTRKRPDIEVAIWNDDDSTSRIGSAGELHRRRKFSTIEMLRYLAVHKLNPDLGIPADVIDAMAIALAGARTWSKVLAKLEASNEERVDRAAHRSRRWQAKADRVWSEHPNLSARRVAELVAGSVRIPIPSDAPSPNPQDSWQSLRH